MKNYNTNLARQLRKTATPTEQKLWRALRARSVNGFKFRRQYSVNPYVVDFYCAQKNLVIEIDGDVHATEEQRTHDKNRENYLKNKGLSILRVTTHEINQNLNGVLEQIYNTLEDSNA